MPMDSRKSIFSWNSEERVLVCWSWDSKIGHSDGISLVLEGFTGREMEVFEEEEEQMGLWSVVFEGGKGAVVVKQKRSCIIAVGCYMAWTGERIT